MGGSPGMGRGRGQCPGRLLQGHSPSVPGALSGGGDGEGGGAGWMVRESLEPGSTYAGVFLSSVNGVRFRVRAAANTDVTTDTTVATDEQQALKEPVWIK